MSDEPLILHHKEEQALFTIVYWSAICKKNTPRAGGPMVLTCEQMGNLDISSFGLIPAIFKL